MFDEGQGRRSELTMMPALIVLACGGGGLLLAFGLCGASMGAHGARALGSAGIILFGFSVVALLVGFVWLLVIVVINALHR